VKILILTQYYPPETGAPQNRLSSLAHHLQLFGNDLEVLTALPNYPKYEIFESYQNKKKCKEIIDDITVYRSNIYVTKKKAISHRLLNYFSFAFSSYFTAKKYVTRPDIIICESPPLFLGITAVYLKRKWKAKLVFNVSDLWPESAEKMGLVKNKWALKRAYKLANWIYKNADLVSGQTQGIIKAVTDMQPGKKVFWLPNGIETKKFIFSQNGIIASNEEFNLLYAGILGHAQGLEVILHAAQQLAKEKLIHFYIIGDGPVKEELVALQQSLQLNNVTFISNQPSEKIAAWLHKCDAYIVPLRKLDLFKGAIPSKLFEPLYFAKPILLGVEGEAKELFIDKGKSGLFFEPENASELSKAILQLYQNPDTVKVLGENGKKYVEENFQRKAIAEKFWHQLQQL
jgi:glycosyltransferase involved in cell wall biosynthesis